MLVKTLVALATEKMLLKTSGRTFLRGIDFMYAAGLAPERLSVMMTTSNKYILQFHSKCDIRPFAANYPSFTRVLRGIVHVRAWRIKSIEFVNVAFDMKDVDNLERTIDKLGVELVLLRNCTYPGVRRGDEAIRFLNALNRKKQSVVCEYGDDRLKHRISRHRDRTQSAITRAARAVIMGDRSADRPLPVIPEAVALPENIRQRLRRAAAPRGHAQAPAAGMDAEEIRRREAIPYHLRNRRIIRRPNPNVPGLNNQVHVQGSRHNQQLRQAMPMDIQIQPDPHAPAAVDPDQEVNAGPAGEHVGMEPEAEDMELDDPEQDRPPRFYRVQDEPIEADDDDDGSSSEEEEEQFSGQANDGPRHQRNQRHHGPQFYNNRW